MWVHHLGRTRIRDMSGMHYTLKRVARDGDHLHPSLVRNSVDSQLLHEEDDCGLRALRLPEFFCLASCAQCNPDRECEYPSAHLATIPFECFFCGPCWCGHEILMKFELANLRERGRSRASTLRFHTSLSRSVDQSITAHAF